MTGKVYCILGGGGSFAINTALYLLSSAQPAQVVGIGRAPLRPEPFRLGVDKWHNYSYHAFHISHEFDELMEYLDELRPDVIINFAAQGEGAASWKRSWRFFDTNATALARLYEALSQRAWFNPTGRFIHIGTSELYGSVEHPAKETDPIAVSSPYSASKAAFDLYLLAMQRTGSAVPMNIIRPSNCYCQGQLLHRIIPRAVVAGLTGQKVPLHGGGKARKSYLHVRDLARAIRMVEERAPAGQVYNVGPEFSISIYDLCQATAAALDVPFDELFEVVPERTGQDGQYWLDSSAIHRDAGWEPSIALADGLGEVVVWARENIDVLSRWPTDYRLRA